jgi:hypothetical protein
MCTVQLPPGVYPIAVKYIISISKYQMCGMREVYHKLGPRIKETVSNNVRSPWKSIWTRNIPEKFRMREKMKKGTVFVLRSTDLFKTKDIAPCWEAHTNLFGRNQSADRGRDGYIYHKQRSGNRLSEQISEASLS